MTVHVPDVVAIPEITDALKYAQSTVSLTSAGQFMWLKLNKYRHFHRLQSLGCHYTPPGTLQLSEISFLLNK